MPIDVEASIERAGGFGKFQGVASALLSLTGIVAGCHALLWVFVGRAPPFDLADKCPMPEVPSSYAGSSAVVDWRLTCENLQQHTLISSLFFLGFMLGTVVLGSVCDSFGRRRTLLLSMVLAQVSALMCFFAEGPSTFAIGRLLSGISIGGVSLATFVWNAELLGRNRKVLTVSTQLSFSVGVCVLSCLAWLLPLWRQLCLATFLVGVPMFGVIAWLPESPKWLEAVGRSDDAKEVIGDIARFNGVVGWQVELHDAPASSRDAGACNGSPLADLLTSPLNQRIATMSFAWFAASLCYYGLALNADGLGNNIYMTSVLGAVAEMPAYVIVVLFIDAPAVGRKPLAVCFFAVGGAACVYASRLSGESVLTVALLGRLAISGAFTVVYYWGCELFPTNIRACALGLQSFCARIAGIMAPFIISSSGNPLLYLGVPAIIVSVACSGLPETVGRPMPDSLKDVQNEEERGLLPTKLGKA